MAAQRRQFDETIGMPSAKAGLPSAVQRKLIGDLADKSFAQVVAALSSNPGLNPELKAFFENEDEATQHQFVAYLSGISDELDTAAILARNWRLTLSVPKFSGVERRVKTALAEIPPDSLSKETILAGLEKHFRTFGGGLHSATRDPVFSRTLLECIRTKQGRTWVAATAIQDVPRARWSNRELQHWNLRHYTSKLTIVLGEHVGKGIFKVADVGPPPFEEIISTVTLATMSGSRGDGGAKKPGDKVMVTYTGGASKSGHTTGLDWTNVGNVGDTFYGLFYKDEPATGLTPPFITDAVYYATWSLSDFGVGWASADWLGTAASSRQEGGDIPGGTARRGEMSDVVASIFPDAATRDFSARNEVETPESKQKRQDAFSAMSNFEVKNHGPMPIRAWIPLPKTLDRTKNWWVDTKTNKFIKLPALLEQALTK